MATIMMARELVEGTVSVLREEIGKVLETSNGHTVGGWEGRVVEGGPETWLLARLMEIIGLREPGDISALAGQFAWHFVDDAGNTNSIREAESLIRSLRWSLERYYSTLSYWADCLREGREILSEATSEWEKVMDKAPAEWSGAINVLCAEAFSKAEDIIRLLSEVRDILVEQQATMEVAYNDGVARGFIDNRTVKKAQKKQPRGKSKKVLKSTKKGSVTIRDKRSGKTVKLARKTRSDKGTKKGRV